MAAVGQSEPIDIPYQNENSEGGGASSGDTDFFDTLDFLNENTKQATGEPSSKQGTMDDRNVDRLPGLPGVIDAAQDLTPGWDIAVFRGLDKVTARVWMFEASVDRPVAFGGFEVNVRRCNKRPPEEPPNTTAFVEVQEIALESKERKGVFSGWMFASSPGLNAVEHPVYDVWLIDCKMAKAGVDGGIRANVDAAADKVDLPEVVSGSIAD